MAQVILSLPIKNFNNPGLQLRLSFGPEQDRYRAGCKHASPHEQLDQDVAAGASASGGKLFLLSSSVAVV